MKAIHVANTSDSRIYYLLESDDDSTGVVVKPDGPPTFVNFFSYVSKKPRIQRVMDSDFHEFLWTGNKGSLKPRWESIFIDRVGNTDNLLSGVEVVTKFNTDTGPNRVEQMNAKANRAIEYRSLLAAGLNEKAFARSAGRMASRVASGSVRGFRRGVRFDPTAIDADMDGFVQEGTQFARPATPRVRTDLTPQGGMRSSRVTFIPPKPVTLNREQRRSLSPEQAQIANLALKEWRDAMDAIGALLDFNDPEEILETWKEWESELSELIGRPIKTAADAREVAALLHTGFTPGQIQTMEIVTGALTGRERREFRGTGSYFSLLDPSRADDSTYDIYEKHQLIAVLHGLKSNPDLQNHTLRIIEDDSHPTLPVVQGRASAQMGHHPGQRWKVNKQKLTDLKKQSGGTREERNALIAADVPSFVEPIPESTRPSMLKLGYRKYDYEDLHKLTEAILAGDEDLVRRFFQHLSKSQYNSAVAHGVSLIAYADTLPEEQRASMLNRAVAVTLGLIMTHEFTGHGFHFIAQEKHTFGLSKEMREISNTDPAKIYRSVQEAIKSLKERLIKNENSDKTILDIATTALDASAREASGYSTAVGPMGPAIESVITIGGDPRLPAQLPSSLSIKQWIRFAEDFDDRDKLDKWLAQPILDANGNSYKATKGLVQYFEGIGRAARKEWGIDLRLAEGDELTLAHVLFGLNPHENSSQLLTIDKNLTGLKGSIPTHRKGQFSGDQSGHLRHSEMEIYPIDLTENILLRVRDSGNGGEIVDSTVLPQLDGVVQLPHDPDLVGVPHGVAPPLAVFRQKGLPEIDDTKPKQSIDGRTFVGTSKTEAVSPEDAAPLLDAYTVATQVLAESKTKLEDDIENLVSTHPTFLALDEDGQRHTLHKMFFQSMVDIEMDAKRSTKPIGTTGKLLSDFVDGKSEQQREEFREEIIDAMLEMLFFERTSGMPGARAVIKEDVVKLLDKNDGRDLGIMLQQISSAASQWNDLSDSRVQALKNIVGDMGYREYASYAGAKTADHILEELLGSGREELVAELMTAMKAGIDIPVWGADGKRRGLTPSEVDALGALYKWLTPDGEPKIRANGETYV